MRTHLTHMAEDAIVEMGTNGRLTIPKPLRKKLGVDGESALLELSVEVADE